jgi:hypothetical protein
MHYRTLKEQYVMNAKLRTLIQSFICVSVAAVMTAALAWSVVDSTTPGPQYDDPSQLFAQG